MAELSIGALAAEVGSSVQTIRYYEKIGLLPAAARTNGNQRRYGPPHSGRLAFIRHSRELGFSIESIRALLALCDAPDRDCVAADDIARQQLRAVEARIKQLNALRTELKRMIGDCSGGRISACHVIEVLADSSHAHCRAHQCGLPEAATVPSPLAEPWTAP
jgi:DNA-binding transcriptional MerR regulator